MVLLSDSNSPEKTFQGESGSLPNTPKAETTIVFPNFMSHFWQGLDADFFTPQRTSTALHQVQQK